MTSRAERGRPPTLRRWAALLPVCVVLCWAVAPSAQAQARTTTQEQQALHLLNRLGFGPRPGDIERVAAMGIERYLHEQLSPHTLPSPERLTNQLASLETLHLSPAQLLHEYGPPAAQQQLSREARQAARQRMRIVLEQATQARLLRALDSPRQLQEVMVDFWCNHFNVFASKGLDRVWIGSYEETAIRPHALGTFRQLLGATATHPAMLFYLDNWLNTAPDSPGAHGRFAGLNENYARELLELHTVGIDGGYTQQDVTNLARVFTGWGLPPGGGGGRRWRQAPLTTGPQTGFFFDARRHDYGEKRVLGHVIPGTGQAEGEAMLDLLARSPATARHISYQLAQYFVADDPPPALVQRLADRFLRTDGDIRAVLNTLFHSAEFWDPQQYGSKLKTPYQYVLSTVRATGIAVDNVQPLVRTLRQLGMPLYECPTPDGYKNTQAAWLNPDAMVRRASFATALARGRLPLARRSAGATGTWGSRSRVRETASLPPVNAAVVEQTLASQFSLQTLEAVRAAPQDLQTALLL